MLTNLAMYLIDHLGVIGVGVAVFLNGLGIPGLSEVLLPLGGVGVREGKMNAIELVVVAYICQMAGIIVSYLIGRYGGVVFVERYGRYIFLSRRELHTTERLFDKWGNRIVAVGAFVPGPQGFVGYAGGIGKMEFWRFILAAAVGKLVWVVGMIYLGYLVGGQLKLLDKLVSQLGIAILVLLIIGIAWYLRAHRGSNVTAAMREEK